MNEAVVRTHAISVEAVGIGKHFGSFPALSDVSLKVMPGSVHGLPGENGAGTSTLVKCLLGYQTIFSLSVQAENGLSLCLIA